MSNSTRQNGYDERFVVPLEASRRGAHRARVSPFMAALPVVAVVAVVAGVVALAYTLLASTLFGGGTTTDDAGGTSVSAPANPGATTPAPSEGTGATAGDDPAASPSPSASPSASRTAAAAPVDKTIVPAVFNGTRVNGLGRRAADRLQAAGWRTKTPATWDGSPVSTSTVFYSTAKQASTAKALLKALGLSSTGVVKQSNATAQGGVTVIVAQDFAR